MPTGDRKLVYTLDDDPSEIIFYQVATTGVPIDVVGFLDPLAFRQAVIAHQPHAAIIDLMMPAEPGDEMCRWLEVCFPDVKRIICTGADGEQYRVLAKECGATYLQKSTPHKTRLEVARCP